MKSIAEIQEEIIEEFNMFNDWMQKYQYLIELGKALPKFNEKFKTDENIIKGCQSRVWLHAKIEKNNVVFSADSDAIMTKGIVALLIRVLSNQKASEIAKSELIFIEKIDLKDQLSPSRANGLFSMIKQMKIYALALNQ